VIVLYPRFRTTYRSHLQGPIGCPETSVQNYHSMQRNIPEECISLPSSYEAYCHKPHTPSQRDISEKNMIDIPGAQKFQAHGRLGDYVFTVEPNSFSILTAGVLLRRKEHEGPVNSEAHTSLLNCGSSVRKTLFHPSGA
jgi:hypothetical protein